MNSIDKAKKSNYGNCGERAHYFALLYMTRMAEHKPEHKVEVLKLSGSGDHAFVRISGDDIGSVIVDPWAFQYFPESEAKRFFKNRYNAPYVVAGSDDFLHSVLNSNPECIPNQFKPFQKALKNVEGVENKVAYFIEKYRDKFPDSSVDSGYVRMSGLTVKGDCKTVTVKNRGMTHSFIMTSQGLSNM